MKVNFLSPRYARVLGYRGLSLIELTILAFALLHQAYGKRGRK